MWNSLLGGIALVSLTVLLINRLKCGDIRHRWKWVLGYISCIIGLCILSTYSLENAFYSFPSASAVAQYACDGDVVMIVDGNESSLIIYTTKSGTQSYMVSPKTATGYRIGRLVEHKETSKTVSMQYVANIIESKEVSDVYVLINGLAESNIVSIQDSLNSNFTLHTTPEIPIDGHDVTRILASAYIGNDSNTPYDIKITDGTGEVSVSFP